MTGPGVSPPRARPPLKGSQKTMTAPPPDDTNYSDDPYSSDEEYAMLERSGEQAKLNRERPELSQLRIPDASQEVDSSRAASPSPGAEDHSPTAGPDAPKIARYAPGPDSPVLGPPGMNPRPAPAEQNPAQANTQSADASTAPATRERPAPKGGYSLFPSSGSSAIPSDVAARLPKLPESALNAEARKVLAEGRNRTQGAVSGPQSGSTSKQSSLFRAWDKMKKSKGRSK